MGRIIPQRVEIAPSTMEWQCGNVLYAPVIIPALRFWAEWLESGKMFTPVVLSTLDRVIVCEPGKDPGTYRLVVIYADRLFEKKRALELHLNFPPNQLDTQAIHKQLDRAMLHNDNTRLTGSAEPAVQSVGREKSWR